MKFRRRNDLEGREGTRPGFTQADILYLRRGTHTPKTQIFSMEELEGEPEDRAYYCAMFIQQKEGRKRKWSNELLQNRL